MTNMMNNDVQAEIDEAEMHANVSMVMSAQRKRSLSERPAAEQINYSVRTQGLELPDESLSMTEEFSAAEIESDEDRLGTI